MDWNELREVDVDLAPSEHALQSRLGVALVRKNQRQQLLAVGQRVLDAHAAMAVGALFTCEKILVRRVVLIDEELVREIKADSAERIASAWRLRDVDCAVRVLRQLETDTVKRLRIFLQSREVFFLDN